jgi:ABC-type multidrug transport system ATPase subunit
MPLAVDSVEARGLGKLFGHVVALRRVDLLLESGSCTLVIGPNGAGKSTLLGLLATLLRPSRGEVLFAGQSAKEHGAALRGSIGFASEQPFAYGELTGRENLHFRAKLYRITKAAERVEKLVTELGLTAVGGRPVSGYSQGERRRLAVASALVHEPQLLLLDEPTSGLDGSGALRLVEQIRGAIGRGAIVVCTTHDPWLGSELGGRVLELRAGQVARDERAPEDEGAFRDLLQREER